MRGPASVNKATGWAVGRSSSDRSPGYEISLSIVSHGQGGLVKHVLSDLQAWKDVNAEVIVTLNYPEDERFLAENRRFPQTVIRNFHRKGFGANHNAAFQV